MTETPPDPSASEHPVGGTQTGDAASDVPEVNEDLGGSAAVDDTATAVRMTIAHVIYNRGLGHSLDTCESLADEIMHAVSDLEAL